MEIASLTFMLGVEYKVSGASVPSISEIMALYFDTKRLYQIF